MMTRSRGVGAPTHLAAGLGMDGRAVGLVPASHRKRNLARLPKTLRAVLVVSKPVNMNPLLHPCCGNRQKWPIHAF